MTSSIIGDSFKKVLSKVYRIIMRNFPRDVKMSLGDIMLQRDFVTHPQFAVSLLLLDIEDYLIKGDDSFSHKRFSQSHIRKDGVSIDDVVIRFKRVIDSCVADGFKEDSFLEIDKQATLMNGTHRTAICLYLMHFEINCKAYCYKFNYWKDSAVDFVEKNGFDKHFAQEVFNKYRKVQKTLIDNGVAFCCLTDNTEVLFEFLRIRGCHIQRICRVNQPGAKGLQLVIFTIDDPDYIIKQERVVSKTVLKLERDVKKNGLIKRFDVSKNCLEGMRMYDGLKGHLVEA